MDKKINIRLNNVTVHLGDIENSVVASKGNFDVQRLRGTGVSAGKEGSSAKDSKTEEKNLLEASCIILNKLYTVLMNKK